MIWNQMKKPAEMVLWIGFTCLCLYIASCVAPATGLESGAVDISGARLDKLEKLFENLSLQIQTTNNTKAENIYGGAKWVMFSGVGMMACLGGVLIIAFRSWLEHKRLTRSSQLLTTSIDTLPENVKREVTRAIKRQVSDKETKFTTEDQKNLRQLVDNCKQDPPEIVQ